MRPGILRSRGIPPSPDLPAMSVSPSGPWPTADIRNRIRLGSVALIASTCLVQTDRVQAALAGGEPNSAEPIVVTGRLDGYAAPDAASATRTRSPLIDISQSIQVLNRRLIEEQDRHTLGEALVNVSGLTPTRPEENLFTQPIVRGFPAEIYLDGLPGFGTSASIDPTGLVGVDRIEVVKGPTSTLYGGGAGAPLGGVINVVSKRPEAAFGGFAALRAGSFSTANPYADLKVPLAGGIAARIVGEYQRNESWIDYVRGNRWSVQPSLAFQLTPNTELLVRGQYDRRSQLEYSGLPAVQGLAGHLDRSAFPGTNIGQPHTTTENRLAMVELRHAFSADVRLTATGHYYDSKVHEHGSFVYPDVLPPDPARPTVYSIFKLYLPGRVKERTVDANLSAAIDALGGHHLLLGGVNYDHTDSKAAVSGAEPVGELDLSRPLYTLAFGTIPAATSAQTNSYETIAAYVQDQATYGPVHLSGSLRYTRLKLRQLEQQVDRTFYGVTHRVGATIDLTDGVALFAGYATGFRGPVNYVGMDPPKPETSRSFEGGLKLALNRAHLSGTIAAFELTRRNVAVANPDNPFFSIQTGEQRARGVEADIIWEPLKAFSLLANYAFTSAQVTRDTTIPIGNRLPRVPRQSGRVAARYRVLGGLAKGLSFGAGITAFSARQITLPNSVSVPGYAAVDAQAAYDFGRFTITASAVNLGGRKAFDPYQYLSFPVVIPTQPRSAYLTLKAQL